MTFKTIASKHAAAPVGPYSPALQVGNMLIISGQIPLRSDGTMVTGNFELETKQVLDNISAILEEAGLTWSNMAKVSIFTTDLSQFNVINDIYSTYVQDPFPARAAVEVSSLPKGARIEMEGMAIVK